MSRNTEMEINLSFWLVTGGAVFAIVGLSGLFSTLSGPSFKKETTIVEKDMAVERVLKPDGDGLPTTKVELIKETVVQDTGWSIATVKVGGIVSKSSVGWFSKSAIEYYVYSGVKDGAIIVTVLRQWKDANALPRESTFELYFSSESGAKLTFDTSYDYEVVGVDLLKAELTVRRRSL